MEEEGCKGEVVLLIGKVFIFYGIVSKFEDLG
jgi:hypothetical protein